MSTARTIRSGITVRLALIAIVLAVILVPFFLFGDQIESWTNNFLSNSKHNKGWTSAILASLLASDIFLPVPSSIVSTGCGYLLGFVNGTITSFIGMTSGCIAGYWLAFGSRKALRWIGQDNLDRLEKFFQRSGTWAIVLARPIPVLGEASVFFAGMSKMKFSKFMLISSLSNLGISLIYAAIGAYSVSVNSFLLAFGGAIALPAVAKFIEASYRRK